MTGQTAHQQYKQVQVKTANQGKLLLMLYQGCVKFLRLGKKSIEEGDMEQANNYIIRSQAIIDELRATLDHEKGGELADNLYNLYDFMKRKLIEANVNKDTEAIDVVEDIMLELLESWQQVVNNRRQNQQQDQGESLNLKT